MTVRVGINGFGRIGRSFTRALLARGADAGVELVAVNDPMGDSAHDGVPAQARLRRRHAAQRDRGDRRTASAIDGQEITQARGDGPGRDPVERPRRRRRDRVDRALHRAGEGGRATSAAASKRVVISAPSGDADATICMGVNDARLRRRAAHRDLERVVHHELPRADRQGAATTRFGIEQGLMTTVHAYTSDQSLQDLAKATRSGKPDLRRMRAAGALDHPERDRRGQGHRPRAARAQGQARRHRRSACPTPTGSITDLVAPTSSEEVTVDEINAALGGHEKFAHCVKAGLGLP